jgi:hypothetical protein
MGAKLKQISLGGQYHGTGIESNKNIAVLYNVDLKVLWAFKYRPADF